MWSNVVFILLCLFVQCLECQVEKKFALFAKEVRDGFFTLANHEPNRFNKTDVERIRGNKWYSERYVLANKDVKNSFNNLVDAMEWRQTAGINKFTDKYFPKRIRNKGLVWILPKKDKIGKTVVWVKFGLYNKSDVDSKLYQDYFTYLIDKVDLNTTNQGWAVIGDAKDCGMHSINMAMIKDMITIFMNYYVKGYKYLAVINLPSILRGTINVVKALMNDELRKSLKFIDREGLSKLLKKDDIPNYLDETNEQDGE